MCNFSKKKRKSLKKSTSLESQKLYKNAKKKIQRNPQKDAYINFNKK